MLYFTIGQLNASKVHNRDSSPVISGIDNCLPVNLYYPCSCVRIKQVGNADLRSLQSEV